MYTRSNSRYRAEKKGKYLLIAYPKGDTQSGRGRSPYIPELLQSIPRLNLRPFLFVCILFCTIALPEAAPQTDSKKQNFGNT